jgi:S1-C subfamily serine protease
MTGRSYWVSKVLERSAANFAGVLEGDILLQVDDRGVSVKDDIMSSVKDDLIRYFFVFFPR